MIIKEHINKIVLVSIIFLYFFDLGNLDAIRQGTEGFYMQISKEMFLSGDYITPTYLGNTHWSKPPLHFWVAQPFFYFFDPNFLLGGRFSIACLSMIFIYLISSWSKRNLNIDQYLCASVFLASIGILKYARIYMMEIPLVLFTTLGTLYFYDYLSTNKKRFLIFSSILLGLSFLVKGPISLAMSLPAIALFTIIKKREHIFDKNLLLWCLSIGAVASSWFLLAS